MYYFIVILIISVIPENRPVNYAPLHVHKNQTWRDKMPSLQKVAKGAVAGDDAVQLADKKNAGATRSGKKFAVESEKEPTIVAVPKRQAKGKAAAKESTKTEKAAEKQDTPARQVTAKAKKAADAHLSESDSDDETTPGRVHRRTQLPRPGKALGARLTKHLAASEAEGDEVPSDDESNDLIAFAVAARKPKSEIVALVPPEPQSKAPVTIEAESSKKASKCTTQRAVLTGVAITIGVVAVVALRLMACDFSLANPTLLCP
jgi:hypothetical protein